MKLLVDVDLNKPLIRITKVCFEGEKKWVSFKYESLSLYCFYCSMIRHGEKVCGKKMVDAKMGKMDEGQYGMWPRDANVRISNKGGLLLKNFQVHKMK